MADDRVLHTQTNGVWQPPFRKTTGCFYPPHTHTHVPSLPECFCLLPTAIVYFCSSASPQMTSQPERNTVCSFSPFSSSVFIMFAFFPSSSSTPYQTLQHPTCLLLLLLTYCYFLNVIGCQLSVLGCPVLDFIPLLINSDQV